MSLLHQIELLRKSVNHKVAELDYAIKVREDEKVFLSSAEMALLDAQEAQKVIQLIAQTVQQQAHRRIAGVVSRCLSAVFDEPYTFQIIFEQKRGKTEARLVFIEDGSELDPMTASGGGVVDIAALALRLSALLPSQPPLRRVLILDEPLRFLSSEYRLRARDLLTKLAEDLDIQIILVTHIPEFEFENTIRL